MDIRGNNANYWNYTVRCLSELPIVSLGISKFSLPHTKGFTMRHTILTLLLALAINPLEHHITNTSPRLLKLYDDNFITIEFWESYDLEKHIGKITFCYFPDSIMNQPSIIKEENIDSDSVSVFFERIL